MRSKEQAETIEVLLKKAEKLLETLKLKSTAPPQPGPLSESELFKVMKM